MAKKKESSIPEGLSMNELIGELMKGTNFEISEESNVLSQRIKVRTPLEAINCILGGGIPLGSVDESFGFPKSGKSTWLYQTMANFQEQYKEGLSLILDNESSADDARLKHFGVDTTRVLRLPSSSIETGFLNLLQILENKGKSEQAKKIPIFVVWDSISKGLAQDGSTQSRMNAQDRARVIKNYMSEVLPQIEKHPFILFLINQVVFETDRYGNRKVKSGGGVGLEHDVHFKVKTELRNSDEWNGNLLVGRYSKMDIVKSKFSPEFCNIPIYIDITEGGKIDEVRSFVDYIIEVGLIPNESGYYKAFEGNNVGTEYLHEMVYPAISKMWKKLRYKALVDMVKEDENLYDFLRIALMEKIGSVYSLQREIMEDYLGEVQEKLMRNINRFEYNMLYDVQTLSDAIDLVKEVGTIEKLVEHSTSELPNSICIKCGQVLDYHEPHCDGDFTLSKSALQVFINEYFSKYPKYED